MDAHNPINWRSRSPRTFIGNHTLSHQSLAALSPLDWNAGRNQRRQDFILDTEERGGLCLALCLGRNQPGSMGFYSQSSSLLLSPCPGTTNCSKDSPHLIWRTEVEAYYSDPQYRFMYSGW